jgi:hypothetical protein
MEVSPGNWISVSLTSEDCFTRQLLPHAEEMLGLGRSDQRCHFSQAVGPVDQQDLAGHHESL